MLIYLGFIQKVFYFLLTFFLDEKSNKKVKHERQLPNLRAQKSLRTICSKLCSSLRSCTSAALLLRYALADEIYFNKNSGNNTIYLGLYKGVCLLISGFLTLSFLSLSLRISISISKVHFPFFIERASKLPSGP